MKVLEWSQQISHCKSMQIFYDALGKLTPQAEVGSTSARMNMIYSNLKALEWSQHFSHYKSMEILKALKGS